MRRFLIVVSSSLQFLGVTSSYCSWAQTVDHWETIIHAEQTWQYMVGNEEPPAAWRSLPFNDNDWPAGSGGIGYGDGDDQTLIDANTISLYLRIRFSIQDTSKISGAILHGDFDDAFVAYINNSEVARENIGIRGDHPAFNQTATYEREATLHQGGLPQGYPLTKEVLKDILTPGENILAIQVHNFSNASSDLSSLFFLSVAMEDQTITYGPVPEWFETPINFTSSLLPIVVINTHGKTILDEPKTDVDLGIIYNGPGAVNKLTDPFNAYQGNAGIELRGFSSQSFPKKQYGMETRDGLGNGLDVSLLGLPEEEDWVLYAPYSDKTLIRNALIYDLARKAGSYAPRTRFCELILDDVYMGVYVLMEKIKRDKNRVNINNLKPDENSGDDLTGGYLVKIDKINGLVGEGWTSPFRPCPGAWQEIFFQYESPNAESITDQQKTYIQNYVTEFERSLRSPDFLDSETGYDQFIDVDSFVDFLLINELSKNVDAYRLSTFMYKDKDSEGGKLTMGPVWDFNLSLGNANYCDAFDTQGWILKFNQICKDDTWLIPFWWDRLLQDPDFVAQLNARWQELRTSVWHLDSIYNKIDSLTSQLENARQRNFTRWPVLGIPIWPNAFVGKTYGEETDNLKNWVANRVSWMDANLPLIGETITGIPGASDKQNPVTVFPNPFKSEVHFSYNGMAKGKLDILIYNKTGKEVKVLSNKENETDAHQLSWNRSADGVPPGMYFYFVRMDNQVIHRGKLIAN